MKKNIFNIIIESLSSRKHLDRQIEWFDDTSGKITINVPHSEIEKIPSNKKVDYWVKKDGSSETLKQPSDVETNYIKKSKTVKTHIEKQIHKIQQEIWNFDIRNIPNKNTKFNFTVLFSHENYESQPTKISNINNHTEEGFIILNYIDPQNINHQTFFNSHKYDQPYFCVSFVQIPEPFQGLGIANALYNYVEKTTGFEIKRCVHNDFRAISDEGKKMWDRRNSKKY